MRHAPPAIGRFLLRTLSPPSLREAIEGDLSEAYARRVSACGRRAARRWYRWQVLRSVVPLGMARCPAATLGRGTAGLVAGILASSVLPFLVAAWIRPEALLAGFSLTLVYLALAATAAFGGGYVCVRVARARSAVPIALLVALLHAPAAITVLSDPALARREAPWLFLAVAAALFGAVRAGRRVRKTVA